MKTLYLKDIGRPMKRIGYQKSYGTVGGEYMFEFGKGLELPDETAEMILKQNPHLISEQPAIVVEMADDAETNSPVNYSEVLESAKAAPGYKYLQGLAKEIGIKAFGLKKDELQAAIIAKCEEALA